MRLDKFLWAVRFYKTRSLASQAIKNNKVLLNGLAVKSAKEIMIGDQVLVKKNNMRYEFAILQVPASRLGAKLVNLYIKDQTKQEEYNKQEIKRLEQKYYREKGLGRPTKKDRRSLDDYLMDEED